jgi:hypothetical protein
VDATRHADLARQLVMACGGFKSAVAIARINKSRLYLCCRAGAGAFLPIDVVDALERACGRRIYSLALAEAFDTPTTPADLMTESAEATEAAAAAQTVVRKALANGGGLDPAEKRQIRRARALLERQVREFGAVVDQVAA